MKRARRWIRRAILGTGMLLLLAVTAAFAFSVYLRHNLHDMIDWWLAGQGLEAQASYDRMSINGVHGFTVHDLRLFPRGVPERPFVHVGKLRVRYSLASLWDRRLEVVSVEDPRLNLTSELDAIIEKRAGQTSRNASVRDTGRPWNIDVFRIERGQIQLLDLGEGIPPVSFSFETEVPDVVLGGGDDPTAPLASAQIKNLRIYSPWDIFTPVLDFEIITIRYRWSELMRKHIEALEFERPTIHIGEDLFWFVDYVKARSAKAPARGPAGVPWTLRRFEVNNGQIALNYLGRMQFRLPVKFQTRVNDVTVGSFENLQINQVFEIPLSSLAYPEYNLAIEDIEGKLEFSIPPNRAANNVVQVVKVGKVRWKEFEAETLWIAVTFDAKGIYLRFGGESYGGYVVGNANLNLRDRLPWDASIGVSRMDVGRLTDQVARDRFVMTGRANLTTALRARGMYVEDFRGQLLMEGGGKMQIPPIQSLIDKVDAAGWSPLRRDLMVVALNSFRDYNYTAGRVNFEYTPRGGAINLFLDGDNGKRNFTVNFKDDIFNQAVRE